MGTFGGPINKLTAIIEDVKKAASEPRIWEYRVIRTPFEELEPMLDAYGKQGWEAFMIRPIIDPIPAAGPYDRVPPLEELHATKLMTVFKREIKRDES